MNKKKMLYVVFVLIICILAFIVIKEKNEIKIGFYNSSAYFSEINIPGLKYSGNKLTYKDKNVRAYFDPLETKKDNGRYSGFVYSKGSEENGINLIVERDKNNQITGVKEISQQELNEEIIGD